MHRRTFLAGTGTALGLSTAGCSALFETESVSTASGPPPLVENRPDAVYVPSHIEGMQMVGMQTSGRYGLGLSYSFPHRFWLITGDRTRKVEIRDADTVHLMLTVWDTETGVVVPSSSASVTVSQDDETVVAEKQLWPMLSQNMGVHFGDNVALDGDGPYEVDVAFGPVGTRRAGALADELGEQASGTFSMEFSQDALDDVMFERLEDREGERDAADPMDMEMLPAGQVPEPDTFPGESLGTATTGDATLAATALQSVPTGVDGSGTYVAVSLHSPYNRYPLPFSSLSGTLPRDGASLLEDSLTETLHPELGYHYGAVVDSVQSGDELTVAVDTPPQLARHEGYETAFVTMEEVSLTV